MMPRDHFALRPQKRGCLLGTGTGGKGTREWRLDRGYRPKKTGETVDRRQNNGSVKAVSPRHCPTTSALRNCCFNCRAGQSHNVRCTAVDEQPEAKEVQLWKPCSTSLLLISSGLRVQLHLPPLDLTWNPVMFWYSTGANHFYHSPLYIQKSNDNTVLVMSPDPGRIMAPLDSRWQINRYS